MNRVPLFNKKARLITGLFNKPHTLVLERVLNCEVEIKSIIPVVGSIIVTRHKILTDQITLELLCEIIFCPASQKMPAERAVIGKSRITRKSIFFGPEQMPVRKNFPLCARLNFMPKGKVVQVGYQTILHTRYVWLVKLTPLRP